MSKRNSRALKIVCALAAIALAISASLNWNAVAAVGTQQDLPEGKGVELARNKCVTCHEADLIVSQRLSKQSWTREVEKMMRWGAKVNDAEKESLIDYFSVNFGPRKPAAMGTMANVERGKQIFEDKCLLCHETDLAAAQRLTKQGWTREVDKMVRWGAKVTDAEKEPLVDYLLQNYGPRPLAKK